MTDDITLFGVSAPDAEQWLGQHDPGEDEGEFFEVLPENWLTVHAFQALKTQWRVVAGLGGAVYQGFEYSAIPPTLSMLGIKLKQHPEIFAGLRIMELAALPVLNERK